MKKGTIIVIEGNDGVGKTTQLNALRQRLESEGHEVVYRHFPTYNEVQGALVTEYLKGMFGAPM